MNLECYTPWHAYIWHNVAYTIPRNMKRLLKPNELLVGWSENQHTQGSPGPSLRTTGLGGLMWIQSAFLVSPGYCPISLMCFLFHRLCRTSSLPWTPPSLFIPLCINTSVCVLATRQNVVQFFWVSQLNFRFFTTTLCFWAYEFA